MLIRLLALAVLVPLVLLAACGDDDDDGATNTPGAATTAPASNSQPKDVTITATDFAFDETEITAAPGQVLNITLVNDGSAEHSFTVGDSDVAEAEGGEEGEGTFTAPAEDTEFHCKYHPSSMKGTIKVRSSNTSEQSGSDEGGSGVSFGY
jgi:cytochrome c oxidase subunit 2